MVAIYRSGVSSRKRNPVILLTYVHDRRSTANKRSHAELCHEIAVGKIVEVFFLSGVIEWEVSSISLAWRMQPRGNDHFNVYR